MGTNYIPKCKNCKGTGTYESKKMDDRGKIRTCPDCEGTGMRLQNEVDEDLDEAWSITQDKLHPDQTGFIEIEEEDYEV